MQGEPAILNILPCTMENFLDTAALSSNKRNPSNENFAIKFDYSFLAPLQADPCNKGGGRGSEECCPLIPCKSPDHRNQGEVKEYGIETEVKQALNAQNPIWSCRCC